MWDPWLTWDRPILWIPLSYAWIPVGLAALTAAVPSTLADHALSIGVAGGMITGMITRTARGHTSRPLNASVAELAAYALLRVAAALRVLLPLVWPTGYGLAVFASSVLWSAAFLFYLFIYVPVLCQPRLDGKPG